MQHLASVPSENWKGHKDSKTIVFKIRERRFVFCFWSSSFLMTMLASLKSPFSELSNPSLLGRPFPPKGSVSSLSLVCRPLSEQWNWPLQKLCVANFRASFLAPWLASTRRQLRAGECFFFFSVRPAYSYYQVARRVECREPWLRSRSISSGGKLTVSRFIKT